MEVAGPLGTPLGLAQRTRVVAQMVKNQPAMWETWVRFLGWEDPLEEGMAIHSGVLAWRLPWTEEAGGFHGFPGITLHATE